jgi:formate hydrogenlyase transcriptional activator
MDTSIDDLTGLPEITRKRAEFTGFSSDEKTTIERLDRPHEERRNCLSLDGTLLKSLYELIAGAPALADVQPLRIWFNQPGKHSLAPHLLTTDLPAKLQEGMQLPLNEEVANWVWTHERPLIITAGADARFPEFAQSLMDWGVKYFCAVPLMLASCPVGILGLASTKRELLGKFDFVPRRQVNIANAIKNSGTDPKGRNGRDNSTVKTEGGKAGIPQAAFEGIIGRSSSIGVLCNQIKVVAPTNSTVLILGETGTGKELIAQAIHNLSPRHDRPFIKVNCAAIPAGLIESELFGHERGSFTGAVERRIGRFEMANGGTLLLDEIGDIPLELQPKLLRVLQQQEFERIGSTRTTQVNVRVVAATSRDLPEMVTSKEFRADLYYRLNVFPLRVPALRERPGDIVLLAQHFVDFYAKQMNKSVHEITPEMLEALSRYCWPGNVRELQNVIERAVILSPGTFLELPVEDLRPSGIASAAGKINDWTTLKELERAHILQALAASNWVLGGPMGAGARLGLARTTLIAKMHKLGIFRARTQNSIDASVGGFK